MSAPRRSRAREIVLQVLYEDDLNPDRNLAAADQFLCRRLGEDEELVTFARGLLAGVRKNPHSKMAVAFRSARCLLPELGDFLILSANAVAATNVDLGTAGTFAVLAGSTITNTGTLSFFLPEFKGCNSQKSK